MKKTIPLAIVLLVVVLAFSSYSANAGVFDPPNGVYTWQWQEYGPRINDLYFRILNPVRPSDPAQELYVDSFDGTRLGWTTVGQSPYLDSIYYPTSYVESNTYDQTVGLFSFQDMAPLEPGEEIKGVTIDGYAFSEDPEIDLDIYISGQDFPLRYAGSIEATDTWSWVFPSYVSEITNFVNTPEKIASLKVLLAYWTPDESSGPAVRLDALRLSIYTRTLESRNCAALEAGEVDAFLTSPAPVADINKLSQEGFTLTNAPGFHYCQIGFNMRKWPFMQDETGNAFRHATAHLVPKEDIIQSMFSYPWGNITERWDNFLPRGQKPWLDPTIDKHPYSIDEAVNILSTAGYSFVDNPPLQGTPSSSVSAGSEDYWLAPNGMPLPAIKFYSPLYAEAPTTYDCVSMTVARMNAAGLTSVVQEPKAFTWYLDKVRREHDFDMYWVCHAFSNYPEHLHSFFHSSEDVPGGDNLDGIHDSALDVELEVIKSSTDLADIEDAVSNAQLMLSELLPHVPVYSRNVVNVFSPDLDGMVNMYGYGSENQWTFLNIHYQGIPTGGTVDWPLLTSAGYRTLVGLNPATTIAVYESQKVLDRIFDSLIAEHPETGAYMPWLATNWNIQSWTAPGGIPGMNLTFWLRNDVKWQDGVQFTADDVRFALQYLQAHRVPQSKYIWGNLVDVDVPGDDPYKVEIYYNTTNYELLGETAKISTRFPRHIWEGEDPYTFEPWTEPHPTEPGLTKLIGTGPFYFVEQVPNSYVLVRANPGYFKKLPASTSQEVEPSGGTISNVAGTASVEIPPGALEQTTTISMLQHPTSEYGGFLINQSEYIVSFGAYKFEPAGAEFAADVTITLAYNELLVDETQLGQLAVFSSDDGVNWYQVAIESIDTIQNTITVKTNHFSLFVILRTAISGTVLDEYTGQPIAGVTISLLETGAATTTDSQGHYSFNNVEPGSYTVEMTLPYGYLTHDAVTKFAELPGQDKANFTLYQASWSGATVPRTIGYWKNWENHYSRSLMESLVTSVKSASGIFDDLTVDSLRSYLTLTRFSTMQQKGEAQLLASWLNIVSAQLGVDVQVDVTSIAGWQTVISDTDGILSVNELLQQIDTYYLTHANLAKEQWETIKNILDALNNGRLFV